ncbi:linoleate 13S-lipoxygenase 3-1, chloroplastic [Vigna angularis]|uniref:linoleate 13S-lipoxygenase 3-1, chloroplastic n=1 Tax=Phaseolus angularis TaxID=3914 RepID=UPI0022B4B898|nr:linoleate 13S-lipoxygenase 3-1, chloroplastic [Vigna angularis]
MGLVKEILGQTMVEALCCNISGWSSLPNRFCIKRQRTVSMLPTFSELKTMLQLPAPLSQSPPFTKLDELASNPLNVTLTIAGTVTIKNSKEMMLPTMHQQRGIVFQLVSTEIHSGTMETKLSNPVELEFLKQFKVGAESSTYKVEFEIDSDFGFPGAITVTNKYDKEIFLEGFSIEGVADIVCNSWVQPEKIHPEDRVFFSNKAYLPCYTPAGLKELRKEELRLLRGNGKGVRKRCERVYDYDVYNDLGNPDKGRENMRPILGTTEYPSPRRCRTGRPPSITDKKCESCVNPSGETYVPRDEVFEGMRKKALDVEKLKGTTRNLIPFIRTCITKCGDFKQISDVQQIYKRKHIHKMKPEKVASTRWSLLMNMSRIRNNVEEHFKFNTPRIINGASGWCMKDEELGRQALAGINPLSIKRLEAFPPLSDLDPSIYGPQKSALKEEHIISHLDGMSVQKAIAEKKLFILDYHDVYIPFLNGMNVQEDRKAYATRTILFLTPLGTLKPIAIELSLPEGESSKQVLTPPMDATSHWLWQIAKAHVCSNDAGVHQLVHHWLRTHACMEPFIVATHRQLSVMHPIFKLLKPHLKHTLQINALAREALINEGGIIESFFSPGKYSTQIISAAYKDWRFDMEALPADLIRRGVAEPDPTQPHGLRLLIEDYPYANDGLLMWFALENFVRTYVNYYYRDGKMVESDNELQAWYSEVINVGHADHANASWWWTLSTPSDLTSILTTFIWVVSVQHAAVNFGQYPLGGYVPMRSPHMKKLLPREGNPEYKEFMDDPEGYLLSCLPNLFETTKFLAVVNILSQHSPDEEYIGQRKDLSEWAGEPEIVEAFYKFSMDVKRVEKEIEKRNKDSKRRNRCGAGIPPYDLLIASSDPGVTCRGVPNSITI